MNATRTLYTVLGVRATASQEDIEAAYASLQGPAGDDHALLRIAYDTLRDPDQRAAYDRKLARQAAADATVVLTHQPVASGGVGWLRLLIALVLVAGGGYWWSSQHKEPPVPDIPAVARAPMDNVVETPDQPDSEGVQDYVPLPVVSAPEESAAPTGHAPAAQVAMPTRGERKPGFDVEYLAWSAFQIRQRKSTGSGVLIGPDRILTNCHVLAGGAMGIVVIHSLTRQVSKVEKYARLDGEDACLLYAPGAGGEVIEWGSASSLKPGDMVYTFGHPGGSRDLIWSEAEFLGPLNIRGNDYLQTANYCRPGSSGGPLLDASGRLVGIVTSGMVRRQGGATTYGACNSLTEASARKLLGKSLFPIGFAPAQYSER